MNKRKEQNISGKSEHVFIDPSYAIFNQDGLFNVDDPTLNRDDQILPFYRLRESLIAKGGSIHTADYLFNDNHEWGGAGSAYYSLGILENLSKISSQMQTRLAAFVIMEPPVVAPHLYAQLPMLTATFERVYVHNVEGDGYSLEGVQREKLHKFYWPIPYNQVLDSCWNYAARSKRVVVINGSHNPHGRPHEQYSTRIEAMVALSKYGVVDLYGKGWHRWWSRAALWWPYWRNRRTLMSIYKGACASKFEVLQQYTFCLCFENMAMKSYMTEKLFDCLYAGTIPLYLGAPDVSQYVPETAYIDCRKFASWGAMWAAASAMSDEDIQAMRESGRTFLASEQARLFFDSMQHIVDEPS